MQDCHLRCSFTDIANVGVFKPPSQGTSGEASLLPLSFGLDADFLERPMQSMSRLSQSSHPPVAHALNGRCSESKSKVGPKKKFARVATVFVTSHTYRIY